MNIELLLIIACFICLLALYFRTEMQSEALKEMYEKLRLLENNLDLTSSQVSSTEADIDFMKGKLNDAIREIHIVDEGRIKYYCALRQEIREINKAIEYLYEEKK